MEKEIPLHDLIERLIGLDHVISREASRRLVELGNKAVPALQRALQQIPVESQKILIYITLGDIKSEEAAAVLLSQFSRESKARYRAIIAKGLGLIRYQAAGPILEQALSHIQDKRLDWSIRIALAHLGEVNEQYRPFFSWLLEKADDPSTSVRVEVVRALNAFSGLEARNRLLERLQFDEDSAVKALAAFSLIDYGLKNVQEPLEGIVEKGEPEASIFALLALSYLQQTPSSISIEELGVRIRSWPPPERVAAVRVLSWFHLPENGAEILTLLIDFLITDNEPSVKREVAAMVGRFGDVQTMKVTEATAILQAVADQKVENEIQLLCAVALVKLGYRQYLDVVREHLIRAKEYAQELSIFVLGELDIELHNELIPFLLDLTDYSLSPKVEQSVNGFLFSRYWRDPRLLPYFHKCLADQNRVKVKLHAKRLLRRSKEGYEPAYHLLKDFLGVEPTEEAIERYT